MQERFDLGQVLSQTFVVLFANFLPFMLLSGMVLSPIIVSTFYLYFQASTDVQLLFGMLAGLLTLLLAPIATAAITYGVFEHLTGKRCSLGDCLQIGIRRLFPVIGVTVLMSFATGLALVLFIVPGLIVATMLYVAVPSCVVERPGVLGALRRSLDLTRGYRWPIFGMFIVLGVLNMGLQLAVELGFSGTGVVYHSLSSALTLFVTSLNATAAALVYHRLRSVKELFHVEEVAAVFA